MGKIVACPTVTNALPLLLPASVDYVINIPVTELYSRHPYPAFCRLLCFGSVEGRKENAQNMKAMAVYCILFWMLITCVF
jgi:hypothetical protein